MPLARNAVAITGLAVLLAACAPTGTDGSAVPTSASTTSHPLAATQLVGRTFADAAAVLRRTTIATSSVGKGFRGAEAYVITANGAMTPMSSADAEARTVVAATFAGSGAAPMDDVRVGLVVGDDGAARPDPDGKEYRDIEDRLLRAMGLEPPRSTVVSYLWIEGGESTEDVFWRFVDRAVARLPLNRDTTAALVGRPLPPVAKAGDGHFGTRDDMTWVDGVRIGRVVVTEDPATKSWQRTTFDIAAQSRVCAVNIDDVLRARYTVTPSKKDDVHTLGEPASHRVSVSAGVIDFFLTTDCITSFTAAPAAR